MNAAFDLAVIGAGPAGAAAALGAARAGLTVALFEPQGPEADKPCGEGILPGGVAVLRELGLADVLGLGRKLERIRYVLASGRELDVPLPTAGCSLERPMLSGALARAITLEPRVTRLVRHVTTERSTDGFVVRSGGDAWLVRALVAADGLQGRAAPWLRGRPRRSTRYGMRARAEVRGALERVEVHLGRTSEVYLTPLVGGVVNVAVLHERSPASGTSLDALERALAEHPRARRQLGAWTTAPESRALARPHVHRIAEDGAFLAGDAAGGVDPVLGCGVALALRTGIAAGRAAERALACGSGTPERDYARLVRHETRLRHGVASALMILARHPRLQDTTARLLASWPGATAALARRIGG